MPKLNVGDIFRYKSETLDFKAILIAKRKIEDEYAWEYDEKIISGNFLSPGKIGHSSSDEDAYITILEKGTELKNLSTKAKNGDQIETTIRKIK